MQAARSRLNREHSNELVQSRSPPTPPSAPTGELFPPPRPIEKPVRHDGPPTSGQIRATRSLTELPHYEEEADSGCFGGWFKRKRGDASPVDNAAIERQRDSKGELLPIRPGGGGIVPGTDAPVSAVNAGDRLVLVEFGRSKRVFPVTPTTTSLDIVKSASICMSGNINVKSAVLLEYFGTVGVQRPLRRYEYVRNVMNSWDSDKQNSLLLVDPASGTVEPELKQDESAAIPVQAAQDPDVVVQITSELESSTLADNVVSTNGPLDPEVIPAEVQEDSDPDSDGGGWITPGNLKKKQAEDASASTKQTPEPKTMQVAVLTSDFAMQNVILQMNLNLLSPSLARVKHLKTYVMRCHACFNISKDLSKQFCGRCGQPSLTRVSCSTNANGEFKLHLKKNMQWNSRGDRYSIPKPVHGSSNGRIKGGGKGGWGNELILAEDQKEYQHAAVLEKRHKERNLMDEDYLPSILTGDRNKSGGRVRVGAGRGVNSKKR